MKCDKGEGGLGAAVLLALDDVDVLRGFNHNIRAATAEAVLHAGVEPQHLEEEIEGVLEVGSTLLSLSAVCRSWVSFSNKENLSQDEPTGCARGCSFRTYRPLREGRRDEISCHPGGAQSHWNCHRQGLWHSQCRQLREPRQRRSE